MQVPGPSHPEAVIDFEKNYPTNSTPTCAFAITTSFLFYLIATFPLYESLKLTTSLKYIFPQIHKYDSRLPNLG